MTSAEPGLPTVPATSPDVDARHGPARGIVTARQRCAARVASARLRRTSQHGNRGLRDIATGITTDVAGWPTTGRRRS